MDMDPLYSLSMGTEYGSQRSFTIYCHYVALSEYYVWFTSVPCPCDIWLDHLHFFEVPLNIRKCEYLVFVNIPKSMLHSDG